ncbi:MAG: flippase-like domain-containing protein, partial [Syntrophales bacterium LBB04]|nr:flippase-like domain-containing protein [Syntrophales bacterium LBB04]
MVNAKRKPKGKKKAGVRWISWLFGLAILVAVALFATHRSEEQEFARLVAHAQPAWLLLGLLLQMGTYIAEARIWQQIILRAGIAKPLWSYMGLGLAKLFMDQVVPSGGMG